MGLEDIPEMELFVQEKDSGIYDAVPYDPEIHGDYISKFIVLINEESGKRYLFADGQIDAHSGCELSFETRFFNEYEENFRVADPKEFGKFSVRGGGKVRVSKESKELKLYGSSTIYGDFDREAEKSILERFVAKRLPQYNIRIK